MDGNRHFSRGNALLEYVLPLIFLVGGSAVLLTLTGVPKTFEQYVRETMMAHRQGMALVCPPWASRALGCRRLAPPGLPEPSA